MTPQHHLPADIERTSMGIITAELAARGLEIPPENAAVVKRVIHTTADFDYAENLRFTPGAVAAPPPPCAVELNAELEVLCAAAQELAARRAGWLYFCPAQSPLAVRLPRRLLQSTVLTFLRGVLRSRGQGVVRVVSQPGAAVIVLQGGAPRMPGDLPALLHRCGPYVTADDGGAAAVRLAFSPTLPLREPPALAELVQDRYSAVRVYLDGYCVEDVP